MVAVEDDDGRAGAEDLGAVILLGVGAGEVKVGAVGEVRLERCVVVACDSREATNDIRQAS